MKILVVMGSPRKGETYAAVRKIEETMHSYGDVAFDYLWLKDAELGQCRGCHACIRFGEEKCPLKNDRADIEARMLAADGIILATPVYANHVSALMKTYIDLFAYLWHRPRFFGKFAMGVASGGGQFKQTLGYLKENTNCWGFTYAAELGAPHAEALVPKQKQKLEISTQKAARRFYETVRAGKVPGPSLYDLIRYRMWRINAASCKEFIPADFRCWTENGWFRQEYYTSQPIGFFKRLFARGMEAVLRRFLRSVYVGY